MGISVFQLWVSAIIVKLFMMSHLILFFLAYEVLFLLFHSCCYNDYILSVVTVFYRSLLLQKCRLEQ